MLSGEGKHSGGHWFKRCVESANTMTQVLVPPLVIAVTLYVGTTANLVLHRSSQQSDEVATKLADASLRLDELQRRASIRPNLKVTVRRIDIPGTDARTFLLSLTNVGGGTADRLVVLAVLDGMPITKPLTNFYREGSLPVHSPAPVQGIPDDGPYREVVDQFYLAPVRLENQTGQDFVLPLEKVEAQLGCFPKTRFTAALSLTLALSYFDSDGHEYATVTSAFPSAASGSTSISDGHPVFDRIRAHARGLGFYEYKTIFQPSWRDTATLFWPEFNAEGDRSSD